MAKKSGKTPLYLRKRFIIALVIVIFASWFVYWNRNRVLPQSLIGGLPTVQTQANVKILVFSPHPDDETLAAGGYIYDSVQKGDLVKIVLVTDGNKHGLRDKRYDEFRQVTAKIGVKPENLEFWGYPDDSLKDINQTDLKNRIAVEIESFQPQIVIIPVSFDTHPDHATLGKEALLGIGSSRNYSVLEYLIHSNYFPRPKKLRPDDGLTPPIRDMFLGRWKVYQLSGETEQNKEAAINLYHTQLKNPFLKGLLESFIRKNELFFTE